MISIRDISNGVDLTDRVDGLRFSNVKPGGFESCSFDVPEGMEPPRGARIRVDDGAACLWLGTIYENSLAVDDSSRRGCVAYGPGMVLKTTRFPMVYVMGDLSAWQEIPLDRKAAAALSGVSFGDASFSNVRLDLPNQAMSGVAFMATCYQAPAGAVISKALYNMTRANFPAGWRSQRFESGSSPGAAMASVSITADGTDRTATITDDRYVEINVYADGTAATPSATAYVKATVMSLFGSHALTVRSSGGANGLYGGDIIGHILSQVSGVSAGTIDAPTSFIIPNLVFDTQDAEAMINEVNRWHGYNWGTWDSGSIFDDGAYFDWTAKHQEATYTVRRSECDRFDVAQTLANMANEVQVRYRSVGGTDEIETGTAEVRALSDAGLSQQASVDGGVTTQAGAQQLIDVFFDLQGNDPPFTGSIDLTGNVRAAAGGSIPPHHIRANGANIRVEDLLPITEVYDLADLRQTLLPIKRVEVDCSGPAPRTSVAVDQTQDALSVLQARLGTATDFAAIPDPPSSGNSKGHQGHWS